MHHSTGSHAAGAVPGDHGFGCTGQAGPVSVRCVCVCVCEGDTGGGDRGKLEIEEEDVRWRGDVI